MDKEIGSALKDIAFYAFVFLVSYFISPWFMFLLIIKSGFVDGFF